MLQARSLLFAQVVAHVLLLTACDTARALSIDRHVSTQAGHISTPTTGHRTESFQHTRRLLQSTADQDLWNAARDGDVAGAEAALAAGANINVVLGEFDETPLAIATFNGHLDVVEFLLTKDADPSIADADGSTPLMLAASSGNVELVVALVEGGADVDQAREGDGVTALLLATNSGWNEVVRALLNMGGADPNKVNSDGNGPLHVASVTIGPESEDIASALLEAGANVDLVGNFGWTPLMWAANLGNVGVVEILLDAEADPSIEGDDGIAFDLICGCLDSPEDDAYLQCPGGGCELDDTFDSLIDLLQP